MKQLHYTFILLLILLGSCKNKVSKNEIDPMPVLPTNNQVEYQKMDFVGFIHFGMNTFTNKEWGYGDESPSIFNPTELDCEQWAKAAAEGGMKELILTAKHHDGFCLWPSKFTEHSVKNSPYKEGKGDIVREFVDACRKYDLKVGLYLSPWDRNHPDYGTPAYLDYYKNQLNELLTEYGDINEIWFDGANGGDGYYGGANETRKIDGKTYYNWPEVIDYVKELQPNIMIFSDAGPDIHWIGNEKGFAGETFWSTIDPSKLTIGSSKTDYLNSGDPKGTKWIIGQCDVSIRPGWFYHSAEDDKVKTPLDILDLYYKSVGRNSVLLLNLPPDTRGLLHDNDVASLKEFNELVQETFAEDLVKKHVITLQADSGPISEIAIQDDQIGSYVVPKSEEYPSDLVLTFVEPVSFDRILLQEPIAFGQRVSQFSVDVYNQGKWKTAFQGTTIGYKRIALLDSVQTDKVRIRINQSLATPAIAGIGLFLSTEKERMVRKQLNTIPSDGE